MFTRLLNSLHPHWVSFDATNEFTWHTKIPFVVMLVHKLGIKHVNIMFQLQYWELSNINACPQFKSISTIIILALTMLFISILIITWQIVHPLVFKLDLVVTCIIFQIKKICTQSLIE